MRSAMACRLTSSNSGENSHVPNDVSALKLSTFGIVLLQSVDQSLDCIVQLRAEPAAGDDCCAS